VHFRARQVILWICVAIGALVTGIMFYSIIDHRKSRGVKPARCRPS